MERGTLINVCDALGIYFKVTFLQIILGFTHDRNTKLSFKIYLKKKVKKLLSK